MPSDLFGIKEVLLFGERIMTNLLPTKISMVIVMCHAHMKQIKVLAFGSTTNASHSEMVSYLRTVSGC